MDAMNNVNKIGVLSGCFLTMLTTSQANAQDWGSLAGGLAGGIIAGAIISSQQPHYVYLRQHYNAPRHRVVQPRVIVVHDNRPVTTVYQHNTVVNSSPNPTPASTTPAATPINNNNIVLAPAPAAQAPQPIIINNSPAPSQPSIVFMTNPTAAPVQPVATQGSNKCQDYPKTSEYLSCMKGTPISTGE
jgi:hypothetical protein